jgi:hypothetical protein
VVTHASASCLHGPPWPDERALAQLVSAGIGEVEVESEIPLDAALPVDTLNFLRLLRDATAVGVWVRWRARLGTGLSVTSICHLPPPSGGTGLALNPAVAAWRESFRPDRFTWRAGPGFVIITDLRGGDVTRTRLDDRTVLAAYERLLAPTAVADISDAAFELLHGRAIVLRLGDVALALPVRQRRPPILYRRSIHSFQAVFEPSNGYY